MTEIIQQWIQDRLGVLLNMSPEEFAENVKDGHLLSEILKSYGIITEEQLNMIEKSNSTEVCLGNFKDHILIWLGAMGIYVDNEDLFEIVNAKSTTALNLFYQVYLELHANSNLYFITQQRLKEKLRPKGRFLVQRVKEGKHFAFEGATTQMSDNPLRDAQDIIHWQRDKMQMLQTRCKEAREEYLQFIRTYQAPKQRIPRLMVGMLDTAQQEKLEDIPAQSVHLTFEDLVREQDQANRVRKYAADPHHSKTLLKKIRVKQRVHSENLIFKTELQRDIFTTFWDRVKKEEEERFNQNVTEIILKQSLFEKQMHEKIGDVKFQKHVMLENKRNEAFAIAKQMEADFTQKLVIQEKEWDEKEFTYYLEKERLNRLHRKLYEQKLSMKKVIGHKICKEVVEDIVKLACDEAEYKKKVGEEPPRRLLDSWKKAFASVIPLDDFVTPTEIILMKPEERPENIEEIVHLEIDKQERMDKKDMESYMGFEWPWTLDDVELDENSLNDMVCALNILGNIVHNLLVVKYPYPPLPPKPDFPNINITACVNGLDLHFLPALQQILELKQILVVQIDDCVNYCVNAYMEETAEHVEDAKQSDNNEGKKGKGKGKAKDKGGQTKEKKTKKGVKAKSKTVLTDDELLVDKKEFVDKTVQTPMYYPGEDIPLSNKAELGKVALEVLESGEALTNHILVAMFIEYLKSKPEIKGWVLINFPKTYDEAAVLEESLTGLPVPKLGSGHIDVCHSIVELVELEENHSRFKEYDEFGVSRMSKILPQPVVPKPPEFYDTSLTAYIKVIKRAGDQEKRDKQDPSPTALEDFDDLSDPLDKFYSDLGCNYHFYYSKMDFNSAKYLAKLILGDYSIPAKSSVELFGDEINYINLDKTHTAEKPAVAAKKGEKKEKPKEKKPRLRSDEEKAMASRSDTKQSRKSKLEKLDAKPGKGKKGKKTKDIKPSKVVIVHEDKSTQAPELEEEEVEEEDVEMEAGEPPKPGEKGWEYVNLPIPESLQIAMATLWENAEDVYLVDMEQVFFMKRLILNAVIPFVNSVKVHMSAYMDKPDEKQKYLREFQKVYNEFDDDFRSDDDFKAELHCRIDELREKLTEICEWKMIAADHERVFIIEKNWTARQLIQLTNNYIIALQLELDRFVDTIILLADYYTGMITKMPSDAMLIKEVLPKLEHENIEVVKAVNSLLQKVDGANEVVLHHFVDNELKKSLNFVDATQALAKLSVKRNKDVLDMQTGVKEKSKPSKKDKASARESKAGIVADTEPDQSVLQSYSQLIDEWHCAISGEVVRVKVRLELLKTDFFRNLDEVLGTIRNMFYEIYHKIRTSHEKELRSINAVSKLLALAVERELKVQEELILDRGDFYVDPEVILFPDKLPPVRPLAESLRTGVFTINQLDKVAEILMDLSPSGYMPERSFSYLLQDLIVGNDEPILVPELWRKLQPRHIDKISKYLFDDIEYLQWKDFVIHNLMIPFPTMNQIVELRKCFRQLDPDATELITDYQYSEIKFWFEPVIEDSYRLKLMRQLLFNMYRVKSDRLNYTALLLDFCKDSNPVVGFAKALTVSLGKAVCFQMKEGEHFVEMMRRKKHNEELTMKRKEQLEGGQEVVEHTVGDLLDIVLNVCKEREDIGENIETVNVNEDEDEDSSNNESKESMESAVQPVPDLAYFLPLEVVLIVITTCLPWNAKVQNIEDRSFREIIEDIYQQCQNSKFDYQVLSHEFLNHPVLVEHLNKTSKFSIKNPVLAVEEMVLEKGEEKGEEKGRPKPKKHT